MNTVSCQALAQSASLSPWCSSSRFSSVTEGEDAERVQSLQSKWTQLEAIVGADKRLDLVARDIVEHYEQRFEAMEGKAMIVCMSRRICVELYDKIATLRSQWHGEEDDEGQLKVVMTRSSDSPKTKAPSTTPSKQTTAQSRFSATIPCEPSPASSSPPFAPK
jgi:type I restriction enzyme, R subunit